MREYNLTLTKMFTAGLRPEDRDKRNQEFLTQCKFAKPSSNGLIPTTYVTDPFNYNRLGTFPFPQLVFGKGTTLLCHADSIQEIQDDIVWSLTDLTTYDAYDPQTEKAIPSGTQWHYVDMFKTWMLFNGRCTVFKLNQYGMFGENQLVLVDDQMLINTGAYYKGRAFLGGFDSQTFFNEQWRNILDRGIADAPYSIGMYEAPGPNFVFWSSIGGGDLLNLLYPEIATYGYIKEDTSATFNEPLFFDSLKRNELGFMPMPWPGLVLSLRPLGEGLVAYGDSGTAALFSVTDPISTIGLKPIAKVGLASRSAVGGNDSEHILVDAGGYVWRMDSQFKMTRLGFREFIYPMLGRDIAISYNENEDEYFICGTDYQDNKLNYILDKNGMSETRQQVTSAKYQQGHLFGVADEPEDTETVVVSDTFDFGIRDLKSIGMIEVIGDGIEYVAVDYRYDSSSEFVRSAWIPVNSRGFAFIGKTAVEFRFCVKGSDSYTFKCSDINIKWKLSGKQTVRGIYANSPRT